MREILFRGKTKESGEWVQGYFVYAKSDFDSEEYREADIIPHDTDRVYKGEYYVVYPCVPETVSQYTNKKDINGTKIFEYDIVKEGCNGLIGVVVWDNDLATYKLDGFGEGYTIQDAECEWEVIGNIYDNPELFRTPQNDEVRE